MQIVIDISEKTYKHIMSMQFFIPASRSGKFLLEEILKAIRTGTPLPKGHGRLIDANALNKKMEEREEKLKDDRSMWESSAVSTALDMFAPTIIEADKGSEEEDV